MTWSYTDKILKNFIKKLFREETNLAANINIKKKKKAVVFINASNEQSNNETKTILLIKHQN